MDRPGLATRGLQSLFYGHSGAQHLLKVVIGLNVTEYGL